MKFEDMALNRQLLDAIAAVGYTEPTPVQEQAIPKILAGQDVLGIAQTGTGKTAAYLLPILMRVKYAKEDHPRALIVAPTRELAMQIAENLDQLKLFTDLRAVTLIGGVGPKAQRDALAKGVDIVVATPGRLMDMYLEGSLLLKLVTHLVIDEADKMMDMGFMPQIRALLEVLPRKRQNLLFSATFPPKVEELSHEFLEYPIKVEVSPQATPVETVKQRLFEVPNFKTKINLLLFLLRDEETFTRVFVFVRTRQVAENISRFLIRKLGEAQVRVVHANKGQNTRMNAMDDFRQGNVRVMVATDVAARGLDITAVSHVINFDFPIIYEDYVHRIGRTGRAHAIGEAITFLTKADRWHLQKLESIIRMQVPQERIPAGVYVEDTPFDEEQAMLREMDNQRKKDDPTFQGAFHEKKVRPGMKPVKAATVSDAIKASASKGRKAGNGTAASASPKAGPKTGGRPGGRSGFSRTGGSKSGFGGGAKRNSSSPRGKR